MKCPICGARLYPGADRCSDCGCHVRTHTAPMEETALHRERRHWGRVLLTILGLLPVLAIIIFTALISVSVRVHQEPAHPIPEPNYTVTIPPDRDPISIPDSNGGCFSIDQGAVTFLPEKWTDARVLQIPGTVNGQQVLSLAPGCFSGCAELTTVLLPETLERIGPGAFSGCTNLRGLYLPETMVSIGADAFSGCTGLEAIYIPASVTTIAKGCFSDCAGLLYIFYDGTFDDWNKLYSGYITPFTAAICRDGTYYHGTGR